MFADAPTIDSDPGAAGHLPQGVLSQAGVDAVVLRQGVLDVELSHASLTGGVRVLDGLLCGGSTGGSGQAARGGAEPCPQQAALVVTPMLSMVAQKH